MAEQSFASHTHRPTHTGIVWILAIVALALMVQQMRGGDTRDWAIIAMILALFELGWISRAYTVKLQDRIIMLEEKVRAAELLTAGQDAQLAKLGPSRSPRCASRPTRSLAPCSSAPPAKTFLPKRSKPQSRPGGPICIAPEDRTSVTPEEQQEVRRLIDAHEHTLQVCRACAETTRDLAWEVKRGGVPSPESLAATLAEVERVLDDIGKVEVAIAEMKAALW